MNFSAVAHFNFGITLACSYQVNDESILNTIEKHMNIYIYIFFTSLTDL